MSFLLDPILHALKNAVTRPKTAFETTKSNITRTLLRPAAILIGTEGMLIGLLGAIKLLKVQVGTTVIELIGAASENMLLLTIMVISTYFAAL